LQVAVLPDPSVTVQVTTVVPGANGSTALLVTLATVQLSEVAGVPKFTPDAVQRAASGGTVTSAGQVIVGSWLSMTVTF